MALVQYKRMQVIVLHGITGRVQHLFVVAPPSACDSLQTLATSLHPFLNSINIPRLNYQ